MTPRTRKLKSPAGVNIYDKLIMSDAHILIAGASGSGKSVLINGFIQRATHFDYIFIDPKRVELFQHKKDRNCIAYADTVPKSEQALQGAVYTLNRRLRYLRRHGAKKWAGDSLYIVIDECADLFQNSRDSVKSCIKIAQLGRAAGVFLLLATQRATATVIPGAVKVNCDYRVALHVPVIQDSRNIIGVAGAEKLPRYGYGLLFSTDGITKEKITY